MNSYRTRISVGKRFKYTSSRDCPPKSKNDSSATHLYIQVPKPSSSHSNYDGSKEGTRVTFLWSDKACIIRRSGTSTAAHWPIKCMQAHFVMIMNRNLCALLASDKPLNSRFSYSNLSYWIIFGVSPLPEATRSHQHSPLHRYNTTLF